VPYERVLRSAMERAIAAHGTIRAAAGHLGMPKSTFADRASKWGLLPRERPRLPLSDGGRRRRVTSEESVHEAVTAVADAPAPVAATKAAAAPEPPPRRRR
jgi:hypothetical protein